jgi:hypothetical protein
MCSKYCSQSLEFVSDAHINLYLQLSFQEQIKCLIFLVHIIKIAHLIVPQDCDKPMSSTQFYYYQRAVDNVFHIDF